ncbi:MAG: NitT/TauT family transport system permease protein [Streptomycetaceae bacterium]|jgi:NitT/TauT family transport system permease protein|nr:NitT/TauT family transport system permease protein [Streptomycetaceae bacterium]
MSAASGLPAPVAEPSAPASPGRPPKAGTPAPVGPNHGRARRGSLARILAPVVVFALVLGLWTYASDHLIDPTSRFLLPPPLSVLKVGLLDWQNLSEILSALWTTTSVALTGLAISMVIGVALGILMSQARWVEYSVYPYAVALQTIPILAVVPLFGFWFGFDFKSRVIVCVLIPLFPIITNTLFGMKSVEAGLHDLFSLYAANRFKRLLFLQLPAALPAILTGFRISAGLAVIGAIIADFFFRQGNPGIGRLIDVYRQNLQTEQLLTSLLLSSLVGLVLFWGLDLLENRIVRRRNPR